MTSTTRSNAWAPLYVGSAPLLVAMLAGLLFTLVPMPKAQVSQDFRAERAAALAGELQRVAQEEGPCVAPSALPKGSIPAKVAVSQQTGTLVSTAVEVVPFSQHTWDEAKAQRLYVRCVIL